MKLKKVLVATLVSGLSLTLLADRTVNENMALSEDADWRADGTVTIASGVTVDLNGHVLKVAALAGEGQVIDSAANPRFSRLEYIQSSANTGSAATHYIDVGWTNPASGYAVEAEYCAVPSASDWPTFCGSTLNYASGSYIAFNKACTEFNVRAATFGKVGNSVANEFRYFKVQVKNGAQTLNYGVDASNVTTSTSSFGGTINCAYNWYIFACNNKNAAGWAGNAKIKYLKIYSSYDTQDATTLVRDFIPVKLTAALPATDDSQNTARAVGTIGLWDLKGGKFYASKTSTPFTGGSEVGAGRLEIEIPDGATTLSTTVDVDNEVNFKYCVYADCALAADADWRVTRGVVSIEPDATLDLNGKRLWVNQVTGTGTITDTSNADGYRPIEYIQSSANTAQQAAHYIDVGWTNPSTGCAVEAEYAGIPTSCTYPTLCGGSAVYLSFNQACTEFDARVSNWGKIGNAVANEFRYFKVLVKNGAQTLYYGTDPANVVTSTATFGGKNITSANNWYIFAFSGNGPQWSGNMKVKYMKIYSSADTVNSSTLVRDFFPVKLTATLPAAKDSQNVERESGTIGLWDRVTQKFYTSKTATPFTGGDFVPDYTSHLGLGELHLEVPAGTTANSLSVALSGGVTLVKEGAGTYVPDQAKTYGGKTVVNAGRLLQSSVAGSLGAGRRLDVKSGAVLELDSSTPSIFVNENIDVYAEGAGADGTGAIVKNVAGGGQHLQNLHLTADTVIGGSKRIDFRSTGSGIEGTNCTLTIKNTEMVAPCANSGQHIALKKLVIDGGVYQPCVAFATLSIPDGIEIINGGVLAPWSSIVHSKEVPVSVGVGGGTIRSDNGSPTIAGNVTIADGETLTLRNALNFTGTIAGGTVALTGGATAFANYDATATTVTGTGALTVTSFFKPADDGTYYSCTLAAGAAVDMVDMTTAVPFDGLSFTSGSEVKLIVAGRELELNEQLASWTSSPSGVTFAWDDETAADSTVPLVRCTTDGIYYGSATDSREVAIATWNGSVSGDASNPANWSCVNHSRLPVEDALPGTLSEVVITGAVNLQAPSAVSAKQVTVKGNCLITADCDWRGLGTLVMDADAVLDLQGHRLSVAGFSGVGEVTDTAAGNLVSNGSFEEFTGTLRTGGFGDIAGGVGITGWNGVGVVGLTKGGTTWLSPAPPDGTYASYIQVYTALPSSEIRQSITVPADGNYLLSFAYAARPSYNDGPALFAKVDDEIVVGVSKVDSTAFVGCSKVVSLTAGTHTLSFFVQLTNGKDGSVIIDNVSLMPNRPGELVVEVPQGQTFANSGTKLSGSLKLVKEGAGIYECNNPQTLKHTYMGGTQVVAGELRLGPNGGGNNTSYCPSKTQALGTLGTIITVESNAVFNIRGQYDMYQYHVVLNGGTLKNDVHQAQYTWYSMGDVTLTADSFCDTDGDLLWGWGPATGNTPNGTLDLGGHTLDVTVRSHYFSYKSTNMVNGTLKVQGAGGLALWHKSKDFETVTIDMGAATYDAHSAQYVHVRDLINRQPDDAESNNTMTTTVYGRFTPVTDFFHNTLLADGAVLDLSGRSSAFSPKSAITPVKSAQKCLTFAEGTITVDIHGRTFRETAQRQLIAWDAPPENVKFKVDAASARAGYRVIVQDDGLYVTSGLIIVIW